MNIFLRRIGPALAVPVGLAGRQASSRPESARFVFPHTHKLLISRRDALPIDSATISFPAHQPPNQPHPALVVDLRRKTLLVKKMGTKCPTPQRKRQHIRRACQRADELSTEVVASPVVGDDGVNKRNGYPPLKHSRKNGLVQRSAQHKKEGINEEYAAAANGGANGVPRQ